MNLPAQIREQVKAATELREQAYGTPSTVEEANKPESETVEDANTPQPEVAAPAAESVEGVRPQENPATPAVEDENSPTYAQRWRSLQGTHNAVLQRVAGLEQLIATMQQAPARPVAIEAPAQKLITPKDDEDFGTDMVDFARRVTRDEMGPVMQALSQMQRQIEQLGTLAPTVHQVATSQAATAEETFFNKLSVSVPDWAQVNDDPKFHEWLLTPDEMTGITRQTYLVDAQRSLDLRRVVSVFNGWKRESGVAPTGAQLTTPQQSSNVTRLEKQIAPGRTNSATTAPSQKAERMWTSGEIAQFYNDRRTGKFKGREAEGNAMERDIFLAQRQGRIRSAA